MIKQAVLFVASTGVLIYFITPVDDDQKRQPAVQEASEPKTRDQQDLSNSWDANGDDENEEFVFGEPLVYSENDRPSSENEGEEEGEYKPAAPQVTKLVRRANYVSPAVYSKAPKPGGLGSKENPIDMSPPGGRQKN